MALLLKNNFQIVSLVLVFLTSFLSASGEETGMLTVRSEPDGLAVWVDSLETGQTPVDSLRLPCGTHTIRVKHPDPGAWMAEDWQRTVRVRPDSLMVETIRFPKPVWVSSRPEHARLFVRDQFVGLTPRHVLCPDSGLALRFEKSGYASSSCFLPSAQDPSVHVTLDPLPDYTLHHSDTPVFRSRNLWITFLLSVSSGIAGYVFKSLAEQSYDKYLEAGHPDTMNRYFDRATLYDRISGACYVVCEVNFGLVIYFSIRGAHSH